MSVAQVISGQPMSDRVNSAQCPLFPALASCLIIQRLFAALASFVHSPLNPSSACRNLRRSPNLRHALPDLESLLLPQSHNLEPLEVCELSSPGAASATLGPCALSPLLVDVGGFPLLLDGTSTGCERDLVDDNVCEGDVRERCGVAGDEAGLVCGGTVDEDLRDEELVAVLEFLFRALVILMLKLAPPRRQNYALLAYVSLQCSSSFPVLIQSLHL